MLIILEIVSWKNIELIKVVQYDLGSSLGYELFRNWLSLRTEPLLVVRSIKTIFNISSTVKQVDFEKWNKYKTEVAGAAYHIVVNKLPLDNKYKIGIGPAVVDWEKELRSGCQQVLKYRYNVVHSKQIAIFMITPLPAWLMIDADTSRESIHFAEVNHPYASFGLVMYKQQRTAYDLQNIR